LLPAERRKTILELIETRNSISVVELSKVLGVSDMTVRRDLRFLWSNGLLERVHGGALSRRGRSYEPPYFIREKEATRNKARIAQQATALIRQGDSIALDVGTTTLELARAIIGISNLSVITASLRIANLLVDSVNLRLFVTGGLVRQQELSLVGYVAERTYQDFHVDKAFIAVGGIHPEGGLTEYNLEDAQVKKSLIASADQVIVLADSRKLGETCFAFIAPLSIVDILITDEDASPELLAQFQAHGVEVVLAS
jgi:DeoR/GlpR family transcriptional regulator of sugar metabolism